MKHNEEYFGRRPVVNRYFDIPPNGNGNTRPQRRHARNGHSQNGHSQSQSPPVQSPKVQSPKVEFTFWELANQPKPGELLPGLIVQKSLTMLFGSSGAGKTFTTLDWACRVADRYKVLYLALEDGTHFIGSRFMAWVSYHQPNCDNLRANLRGRTLEFDLHDDGQTQTFIEDCKRDITTRDLIVFDTLSSVNLSGDESKAKDANRLARNLRSIRKQQTNGIDQLPPKISIQYRQLSIYAKTRLNIL